MDNNHSGHSGHSGHSDQEDCASFIDELVPPECSCSYCFLKFYLTYCHTDRRMLIQLKCIEKFKLDRSEQKGHQCSWQEAIESWSEEGYALEFANCYPYLIHVDDIYAHCKNIIESSSSSDFSDKNLDGWEYD